MTRAVEIMQSPKKLQNTLAIPGTEIHNSYGILSSPASSTSTRSSSYSPRFNPESSQLSRKRDESVKNGYHIVHKDSSPRKSKYENKESHQRPADTYGLSPYEKLIQALNHDQRMKWEMVLGKRIGFYSLKGDLGTGNFSKVKIGMHALTKERVAIKILDKTKMDKKTKRLLSREISSMEKLHHPNIVRLYEVIHTRSKLYLVMEYACGGELFSKLSSQGRMPEIDARVIFSQILSAVEHMHQHSIIHRDLKAENVFYSEKKIVKVGDFGFSTKAHGSKEALNTFCGSPPYAAPELFRDSFYYGEYVDIWALGILLYFAVTGTMPFRAETVGKLKKRILIGQFSMPAHISSDCKHLIRNILKPSPTQRFSLKDIRQSSWLSRTSSPHSTSFLKLDPTKVSRKEAQPEEAYALYMMEKLGLTDKHLQQVRTNSNDSEESTFSWHSDLASDEESQKKCSLKDKTQQNGSVFSSQSSIMEQMYTSPPTLDTSSAIIGTYRILLLRGQKKMTSSSSKEDLQKISAITFHVSGREASHELVSRPCEDCAKNSGDGKGIASHKNKSNGTVIRNGDKPTERDSSSSNASSSSASSNVRKKNSKGQNFNGDVKSKFCVIL